MSYFSKSDTNMDLESIDDEKANATSDKTSFEQLQSTLNEMIQSTSFLISLLKIDPNKLDQETRAEAIQNAERNLTKARKRHQELRPETGQPKDWNSLFQNAMSKQANTTEERLAQFEEIVNIASNFERTAIIYGKIIINEVFLQNKFKTIKSAQFGGEAGGQKYLHNDILFKFATDWKGIYGSDEAAMKAASCEMRGLMSVIEQFSRSSQNNWLSLPLITLIDYQGFRLIAQSVLPISVSSLIYGSSDGGNTVHVRDALIEERMVQLGKMLNLASHVGGNEKHQKIYFPTDIEVHEGSDGRIYMIDFARVLPPTLPDGSGTYLFRHFRPEFMHLYPHPLSPDAFSNFDAHEPYRNQHQDNIKSATEYLFQRILPNFAVSLEKTFMKSTTFEQLNNLVHQAGINIRYIGIIRHYIKAPYLNNILLLEMTAREIKNCIRHKLRTIKKEEHSLLATRVLHQVILKCFNHILANSLTISKFWRNLWTRMNLHYPFFPTNDDLFRELESRSEQMLIAFKTNVCTFCATGIDFQHQIWYKCYTCQLVEKEGVCEICAEVCHAGHKLSNPHFTKFYCDCGERCLKRNVKPPLPAREYSTFPLRDKISNIGLPLLFQRVTSLTGIRISPTAWTQLANNPSTFVFVLPDIEKILCKSKHMSLISRVEANALHLRSLSSPLKERARLFPMAIKRFEESLQICTTSSLLLQEYAQALSQQALYDHIDHNLLSMAVDKYLQSGNISSIYDLLIQLHSVTQTNPLSEVQEHNEALQSVHQKMYEAIMGKLVNVKTIEGLNFVSQYCKYLMVLDLSYCIVLDNENIYRLTKGCPLLCILNLNFAEEVTDTSVLTIAKYSRKLTKLSLDGTSITDKSLASLAKYSCSLHSLSIQYTSIDNKANTPLSIMTELRSLNISHCCEITQLYFFTQVTTLERIQLHHCCSLTSIQGLDRNTNCFMLSANFCPAITGRMIHEVLVCLTNLEYLYIKGNLCVTDEALAPLERLPKLIHLGMDKTGVSQELMHRLTALQLINYSQRMQLGEDLHDTTIEIVK